MFWFLNLGGEAKADVVLIKIQARVSPEAGIKMLSATIVVKRGIQRNSAGS